MCNLLSDSVVGNLPLLRQKGLSPPNSTFGLSYLDDSLRFGTKKPKTSERLQSPMKDDYIRLRVSVFRVWDFHEVGWSMCLCDTYSWVRHVVKCMEKVRETTTATLPNSQDQPPFFLFSNRNNKKDG